MVIDSGLLTGSLSVSGSYTQTGDAVISGSLTVTGNINATISGSATSASFATTASYVSPNTQINTASFAVTASYARNVDFNNTVSTASFATTASYVSPNTQINTASFAITASHVSPNTQINTASFAITSSYARTVDFNNTVSTASFATTASYVSPNTQINTASFAITASYVSPNTQINTASFAITSSYALNAELLDGFDSSVFVQNGTFNGFSSSLLSYTQSNDAKINAIYGATSSLQSATSSLNAHSASMLSYTSSTDAKIASIYTTTSSLNTRVGALEAATASIYTTTSSLNASVTSLNTYTQSLTNKTASFATTGSNTFTGTQYVSNASQAANFTSTASIYTDGGLRVTKDAYVSGTLYLNNLTVFGTQSVSYISSSQLNIGTNIISVNTDTPSVRFGGLAVYDSGSTGLTGSILWDSQENHWVYTNPSGSTYSGGMLISGPRASSLGSEQGTTLNALMKGQGGDHITSSGIFESASLVGIGTSSPIARLDVRGGSDGDGMINIGGSGVSGIINSPANIYINADSGNGYSAGIIGFGFNRTGYTGGTEVMRILENGNVGIGTPTPSDRLTVTDVSTYTFNVGAASGGAGAVLYTLGSAALTFATSGSSNERMRITSGGSVGIGTTNAVSRLTVSTKIANASSPYAAGDSYIALTNTAHTNTGSLMIADNGNTWLNAAGATTLWLNWYAANAASSRSDLRVGDGYGGGEILSVIGSTRRVGINSSVPGYTLDVKGNMYVSASASGNPLYVAGGVSGWVIFSRSGKELYLNANYGDANQTAQVSPASTSNMGLSLSSREVEEDLYITGSTGFVGIGTKTPSFLLNIYGSNAATVYQTSGTGTGGGNGFYVGHTGNISYVWNYNNFPLVLAVNNAEVMRITGSNVGIGTTSPTTKLHTVGYYTSDAGGNGVEGGYYLGNSNHGLRRPGSSSNDVYLYTTSGTVYIGAAGASSTHITVLTGGNVGIGTTAPAYKLDVSGTFRATSTGIFGGDVTAVGNMLISSSTNAYAYLNLGANTGYGWQIGKADNSSGIAPSNGFYIYDFTNSASRMVISQTGNVGIGTIAPSNLLTVEGNNADVSVQFRIKNNNISNGNKYLTFLVGGSTGAGITGWANSGVIESAGGTSSNFVLGNYEDGPIIFQTNNRSEKVRILSGGSVGIGTTAPTFRLSVQGIAQARGGVYVTQASPTNTLVLDADDTSLHKIYTNSAVALSLGVNSSTSNLRINTDGYVSMGTTGAATRLTVLSDASRLPASAAFAGLTTAQLTLVGSDGGLEMFSQDDNTTWGHYLTMKRFNGSTGALIAGFGFSTFTNTGNLGSNTFDRMGIHYGSNAYPQDNAELMSIKSGGNVGIGTSSPGTRLHVYLGNSGATPYNDGLTVSNSTRVALNLLSGTSHDSYVFFGNPTAGNAGYIGYENTANRLVARSSGYVSLVDSTGEIIRITGGSVGIGTTSPSSTFHVRGLFGAPSGSGNSQNGIARLGQTSGNGALDIGFGDPYSWLQSRDITNYATNYNLSLQPNGGNVGIGTTAPSVKFHVNNNGGTGDTFYVDAGNAPGNQVLFEHSGANTPVAFTIRKSGYVGSSDSFGILYIDMAHNVTDGGSNLHFTLRNSAGSVVEYGGLGGYIIDNSSSSADGGVRFWVTQNNTTRIKSMDLINTGDLRVRGDVIAYYSFSDERLKTNITPIEGALEKVTKLQGVNYEWKDGVRAGQKDIGLIAQQVQEIVPEVVREQARINGENYLSVNYEHLTGVLIEAIKEQQQQIDELKYLLQTINK